MSSYVVSNATINYFLNWMWSDAQRQDGRFKYKDLGKLGYDVSRLEELPSLGQILLEMNVEAVNYRYQSNDQAETFVFKSFAAGDVYQAVKALKCFLYQCSEGDIDQLPLFQAMERISLEIMDDAFCASPKYNAAKWGVEDADLPKGVWLTA